MTIRAARLVTVFVEDHTLTIVSLLHAVVRAASVKPPDVDNAFAVDVNGDACANLFTGGDVVSQRGPDFVEAVVAVSANYIHRVAPLHWYWGSTEQGEQRRARIAESGIPENVASDKP
jgi:hypothetical protein